MCFLDKVNKYFNLATFFIGSLSLIVILILQYGIYKTKQEYVEDWSGLCQTVAYNTTAENRIGFETKCGEHNMTIVNNNIQKYLLSNGLTSVNCTLEIGSWLKDKKWNCSLPDSE